MILDKKYIIITNKEQIKPILHELYKYGYKFEFNAFYPTNESIEKYLYEEKNNFNEMNPFSITSIKENLYIRNIEDAIDFGYTELNIEVLFRDSKLKRILK